MRVSVGVAVLVTATALVAGGSARTAAPLLPAETLLVSGSSGSSIWLADTRGGNPREIRVGTAPWGIAVHRQRAFVSTAQGVAIVDLARRRRVALVPYRKPVGRATYGEYRGGGMGIAASPNGSRVYVGVYRPAGRSTLEVLDTSRRRIAASVPVGDRPFDVLVSRDGREAYSIDHDSYSVTVVDTRTLASRRIAVDPLGGGAFDKPHYAAIAGDGRLLLPIQGEVLAIVDPQQGSVETRPLTADTHQHGAALTSDDRLVVVGTGPAGGATRPPSLTVYDLDDRTERIIPLGRPHEQIALSRNQGWAYLSGGYLLGRGFDGVTAVHLASGQRRHIAVPQLPLDVAVLSGRR